MQVKISTWVKTIEEIRLHPPPLVPKTVQKEHLTATIRYDRQVYCCVVPKQGQFFFWKGDHWECICFVGSKPFVVAVRHRCDKLPTPVGGWENARSNPKLSVSAKKKKKKEIYRNCIFMCNCRFFFGRSVFPTVDEKNKKFFILSFSRKNLSFRQVCNGFISRQKNGFLLKYKGNGVKYRFLFFILFKLKTFWDCTAWLYYGNVSENHSLGKK